MDSEQIKKALEWCTSGGNCMQCVEDGKNPHLSVEGCMAVQMRNALALITSQEQRIKELTEENEYLTDNLVKQSAENVILTGENKRLMKALNTDISVVRVVSRGSGKTAHLHEVMRIKVDAVRAAAVRELSDRFIAELRKDGRMNYYIRKVLDQIEKEMLEVQNDT